MYKNFTDKYYVEESHKHNILLCEVKGLKICCPHKITRFT